VFRACLLSLVAANACSSVMYLRLRLEFDMLRRKRDGSALATQFALLVAQFNMMGVSPNSSSEGG
jgi:hypothetical protein